MNQSIVEILQENSQVLTMEKDQKELQKKVLTFHLSSHSKS